MHHIFGVLRLTYTIFGLLFHLCCFGFFFFARIGLDYYTTNNNAFNNTFINNLIKLYNITCAFFNIQDYIFQTNHVCFFEKPYNVCKTLILMISNIIKVQPYNTRKTIIINKKMEGFFTPFKKNMQINISQNINHELSTSKSKNL